MRHKITWGATLLTPVLRAVVFPCPVREVHVNKGDEESAVASRLSQWTRTHGLTRIWRAQVSAAQPAGHKVIPPSSFLFQASVE
jgi:hypothetical protein